MGIIYTQQAVALILANNKETRAAGSCTSKRKQRKIYAEINATRKNICAKRGMMGTDFSPCFFFSLEGE
jgi:hypothetical protein